MIYVFEAGSIVYDGSVLSKEDKERAVAVEELPIKETLAGKTPIIKVDKKKEKVWWEYVDSPKSIEFQEINTQLQGLQQALAEVTLMMMGGE